MSEKNNNIIDILGELGTFEISDQKTNADIEKTRAAIQSYQPGSERKWSYIMNHKLTSIAAVLVIIIGVFFALNRGGVPIDGATVAWADVMKQLDNLATANWLHISKTEAGKVSETWLSAEKQIYTNKTPEGDIEFRSKTEKKVYLYTHADNTLRIKGYSEAAEDNFPSDPAAFTKVFIELMMSVVPVDSKIVLTKTETLWDGNKASEFYYEIVPDQEVTPGCKFVSIKYIIEQEKRLLREFELYADNTTSAAIILSAVFDYSEIGPADIYELGAPENTTIIDNSVSMDHDIILEKYINARNSFLPHHVAISNKQNLIAIIYRDGLKLRRDDFCCSKNIDGIDNFIKQLCTQDTVFDFSFSQKLVAEIAKYGFTPNQTVIFDDDNFVYEFGYIESPGEGGKLKLKQKLPMGFLVDIYKLYNISVDKAWPNTFLIDNKNRTKTAVFSDEYSIENGLIGIETLENGTVYNGEISELPLRHKYYLDPAKDYICHREVEEYVKDASWQTKVDWLKGITYKQEDGHDYARGRISIKQVTEYKQTQAGQWYPAAFISGSIYEGSYNCMSQYDLTQKESVTIIENPKFGDDLLDPEMFLEKYKP